MTRVLDLPAARSMDGIRCVCCQKEPPSPPLSESSGNRTRSRALAGFKALSGPVPRRETRDGRTDGLGFLGARKPRSSFPLHLLTWDAQPRALVRCSLVTEVQ